MIAILAAVISFATSVPKPNDGGMLKIGRLIVQQVTPRVPRGMEKGPNFGSRTLGICGGPIGPRLMQALMEHLLLFCGSFQD